MKTKLSESQIRTLVTEALIEELKSRPEKLTEAELQELLGALKGGLGKIAGGIAGGIGRAAGAVAGGAKRGYEATAKAVGDAKTAVVDAAKVGEDIATLEKVSAEALKIQKLLFQAYSAVEKRGLGNAQVLLHAEDTTRPIADAFLVLSRNANAVAQAAKASAAEMKSNQGKPATAPRTPGEREATPPQAPGTMQAEARRVYEILERNGLTKKRG